MKVRTLFSIVLIQTSLLILPSNVCAQNQKVKLIGRQITLIMAFEQIEKQTGLSVDYDAKTVDINTILKLTPKGNTLYEVLAQLFLGTNYKFKISQSHIIITALDIESKTTVDSELLQKKIISGVVTDNYDTPLLGVSIIIKGTAKGTMTDTNGKFEIEAYKGAVLRISYIGYESRSVTITENLDINIKLLENSKLLNEVVAIGYGQQKRVNVIGSIATIESRVIENRSITTLSSALAGLAAGVYVNQSSGRPGLDDANILIRGTGTLNNTMPLVVIDGIVGSIDAVNPNDVERISVLKDAATAAIYGSLASNGVILITTKRGVKSKTTVTYTGLISSTEPMHLIHAVTDYVKHMQLVNEGYSNVGQAAPYTDATIKLWQDANANPNGLNSLGVPNYVAFPNTDWSKVIFSQKQLLQVHNINLNGGTENTQFMVSCGYLNNPGTMPNTSDYKYQMRVNLQSKVTKFLTVGTYTFGSSQKHGNADVTKAYDRMLNTVPGVYPIYKGKYGFPSAEEESATANNPLWELYLNGGNTQLSRLNSTVFANLNIMKGLTFEAKAHYDQVAIENNSHPVSIEKWNLATNEIKVLTTSPANLSTSYSFTKSHSVILDDVLRYNTIVAKNHDIGVLVGYNQQYYNSYNFGTSKIGLLDPTLTTLNSAASVVSSNGDESDYAMRSYFGRLNYGYKQRYLFEAVVRYDGSSRFGFDNKWGVFPAFSGGWRISEEPFMNNTKEIVDNLKLRISWGKTGNNAAGNYDAQSVYRTTTYSFAGLPISGLVQSKFPNSDLKWESTTATNFGLDGTALNGTLNFTLEVYHDFTDGILFVPTIPITVGTATAATQNIAQVSKNGVEFNFGYNGKLGDFKYGISANISYNHNNVVKYKGALQQAYTTDANGKKVYTSNLGTVSSGGNTRIIEGHSINEYYLYKIYKGNANYKNPDGSVNINGGPKDGIIRTTEDMDWLLNMVAAGYKMQPSNSISKSKIWYGDLIYADTNGDGIYGNTFDQEFTGKHSTPSYYYGFNLNFAYKGFDLSTQWAGAAGMFYFYNTLYLTQSVVGLGKSISTLVANDHYYYNDANPTDPTNNINGHYPRLKSADAQNNQESEYYLYDASYIKLKNLQFGYSLPVRLIEKVSLSNVRIYIGGENLLVITKYPGLDPEIGAGLSYPTMRQYSLGLNVTF